MKIPFVGAAYNETFARSISTQTCVNWYLEIAGAGSKTPVSLMPTPGMVEFGDTGTGKPVVAAELMGKNAFFVSNGKLFKTDISKTVTELGTMDIGTGRVAMANNGDQVICVNEKGGWVYSASAGLVKITDTDFPGATDVCYFDGYFVFIHPESGRHFICALKDGTDYDALDYATAEGSPDDLVACMNDHRELWLFGSESTEIWYNSGDSGYPFDRLSGAFIELGCAARHSPAKMDNTTYWLANDNTIRRAAGYVPQRISTHAMEREIEGYKQVNDAVGYTYSQAGHTFYVLTFPTVSATWVYDASTGAWHERKSYGINRHRGNCYVKLDGKHLVGDYADGKIYRLDNETYLEAGNALVRERVTQVLSGDGQNLFMGELEVEFDQGSGFGSEAPQAMMQWSDDGGNTWSNEKWVSLGKLGKYKDRAVWRRLGKFRSRVFRLRISDATKAVVLGATAEIEAGY